MCGYECIVIKYDVLSELFIRVFRRNIEIRYVNELLVEERVRKHDNGNLYVPNPYYRQYDIEYLEEFF